MFKDKKYIIMIPEAIAEPWFLDALQNFLLGSPGQTSAYGIVGGIDSDGELVPRNASFDLGVKVKVDSKFEANLYGLMDEMLGEALNSELERLNATIHWTVNLNSKGKTHWNLGIARRGKILIEMPASLRPDPGWLMMLLSKTSTLSYPEVFKPLNEEILFLSTINPDVEITGEHFDQSFDSGNIESFNSVLLALGIPTSQNDSCWCGSGTKRKHCHR